MSSKPAAKHAPAPPVGQHPLFHKYVLIKCQPPKDGFLHQGIILGVDGDLFLVQTFEWAMGEPASIRAIPKSVIYDREFAIICPDLEYLDQIVKEDHRKQHPK